MDPQTLSLVNRLKSLGDACPALQHQLGDNPKAAELLYCIKGLVSQLVIEHESSPALAHQARLLCDALGPEVFPPAEGQDSDDLQRQMRTVHGGLSKDATASEIALCKQLAKIETDYTRKLEEAFQASQQPREPMGVDAEVTRFDPAALRDYLCALFDKPDLSVTNIDVLSGGFSKQTLKVDIEDGGDHVPATLVLRLDLPAETAFSVTTVDGEYPKLSATWGNGIKVPRPYVLEASGKVLGRPFIVLDMAPGKTLGTLFNYPPANAELGKDIARQLARIHRIPVDALYAEGMARAVPSADQIKSEIDLSRSHWNSLGRDSTIVEEGFASLERSLSLAEGAYCLVHGDMGLHNILVDDNRVSAVLDWEFAKIGNPADDLGYIQDTATHLMGWDHFLAAYEEAGGVIPPEEQIDFYRLLSLVRICVLVTQADAAFCAGTLPQIQYAPPGSYFLRKAMIKLGDMVQRMG
jgi:aminoglycoside phosphotransferase (APT) family kinase protein